MRKKLIVSSVLCTGALSCWKMNSLEIWRLAGRNCSNSIMISTPHYPWLRDRQVSNWCNVNHLCLADWCHQWLNVNCVRRRFVTTSFFLVDRCAYSRSLCEFFGAITVNVFLWIIAIFEHKHFTTMRLRYDAGIQLLLCKKLLLNLRVTEFWKSVSIWQS